MKVYVAADFARAAEAQRVASTLDAVPPFEVVSRWHREVSTAEADAAVEGCPPPAPVAMRAAHRNLEDLRRADVVVVLTTGAPARGGRHFEMGYACALGTPVVVVGPVEHAFQHLAAAMVEDPASLAEALASLVDR